MKTSRMKLLIILSSLLWGINAFSADSVCSQVLGVSKAPAKKAKKTTKAKKDNLDMFSGRSVHDARYIGEELSTQKLMEHLNFLTGVLPIDQEGCISDRCSHDNKIRTRQYFVDYFSKLGYDIEIQTVSRGFGPSTGSSFSDSKSKESAPLNLKTASDDEILSIWMGHEYSAFISLIQSVLDWEDESEEDIEKLRDVTQAELKQMLNWPNNPYNRKGKPNTVKFRNKTIDLAKVYENPNNYMNKDDFKDAKPEIKALLARLNAFGKNTKKQQPKKEKPVKKEAAPEKKPSINDEDVNLVVEIKGTQNPEEVYEITAHYDTVSPNVPGADDNGSGVVTLLEIARLLKAHPPKRTVRLVLDDLEEKGMHGSSHHVKTLSKRDEKLIGVLVLDMFGYAPLDKDGKKPVFNLEIGDSRAYKDEQEYRKVLAITQAIAYQFHLYNDRMVRLNIEETNSTVTDRDTYTRAGISSLLVSAPYHGKYYITPGYHNSGDVVPQMNWGYFTEIAKLIVESTARITGMDAGKIKKDRRTKQILDSFTNTELEDSLESILGNQEEIELDGGSFDSSFYDDDSPIGDGWYF